jgi:hypothetical protein
VTAIQRWYFYEDDGSIHESHADVSVPETEQWCKAADVAQLELLLKRYLEDLSISRQSRERAKADLAIADAKIASLEAESIEMHGKLDAISEAIGVVSQALLEVEHAQSVGSSWYTKGHSGLYRQVSMWVRRGQVAIRAAQGESV